MAEFERCVVSVERKDVPHSMNWQENEKAFPGETQLVLQKRIWQRGAFKEASNRRQVAS